MFKVRVRARFTFIVMGRCGEDEGEGGWVGILVLLSLGVGFTLGRIYTKGLS